MCFFGGSGRFLKVLPLMGHRLSDIVCIFDNAEEKWGTFISGIPIRAPGQVAEINPGSIFVTTTGAVDVVPQLLEYKTRHDLNYEIFIVNDLGQR
jgi:hypothetical protein